MKTAEAAEQKAQVAAAEQEVARYQALIAFKQLTAPFDGVVTARSTNEGDYVNAAGGDASHNNAAASLFTVADIHKMRIFVSVPQEYADVLKPGLTATLTLPQTPDNSIPAQFLTAADAVDPATRTIVTELTVDNASRKLWPGAYVDVHFTFPGAPNVLILPEQALLFRAQGMQVAALDDQDRVHLRNVILGKNLDTEVEIVSGLKATDKVVGNPSLGLLEGQQVKIVQPVAGYQPGQGNPPSPRFPSPPAGPTAPDAAASRKARSVAETESAATASPAITDGGWGPRTAGWAGARRRAVAVTGTNHVAADTVTGNCETCIRRPTIALCAGGSPPAAAGHGCVDTLSHTGLRQLADALAETGLLGITVLVAVGGTIAANDTTGTSNADPVAGPQILDQLPHPHQTAKNRPDFMHASVHCRLPLSTCSG